MKMATYEQIKHVAEKYAAAGNAVNTFSFFPSAHALRRARLRRANVRMAGQRAR